MRLHRMMIFGGALRLAACGSNGTSEPLAGSARLLIVHAIADTGTLDVRLATKLTPALTALPYGTSSGYQSMSSGPIQLSVQPWPSVSSDSPRSLTRVNGIGSSFTFAATGQARDAISGTAAGISACVDDVSPPVTGQARLRVINASPDAGAVDVCATVSGGASSVTPTFAGVDFRSALSRTLPAGTYAIRVTPLSYAAIVLTRTTVTLPSGGVQTVVVRGFGGTLPAGQSATCSIARTAIVNLAPDSAGWISGSSGQRSTSAVISSATRSGDSSGRKWRPESSTSSVEPRIA